MHPPRVAAAPAAVGIALLLLSSPCAADSRDQIPGSGEDGIEVIALTIDLDPGSRENVIELGSDGGVAVAILSTDLVDAADVDPLSIRFASAAAFEPRDGRPLAFLQDLNGDGRLDLLVAFAIEALELTPEDRSARLEARMRDGTAAEGVDKVRVISRASREVFPVPPPPLPPANDVPADQGVGVPVGAGSLPASARAALEMLRIRIPPAPAAAARRVSWGRLKAAYR